MKISTEYQLKILVIRIYVQTTLNASDRKVLRKSFTLAAKMISKLYLKHCKELQKNVMSGGQVR